MIKKIITIIAVIIALTGISTGAYAMNETTAEIPVEVKENGTVVIESVDNAPLPDDTEMDISNGSFIISYTEPDTYCYKIYQKKGSDKNTDYDDSVYEVIVSVLADDEGLLYSVVSVFNEGSDTKSDIASFVNTETKGETNNGTGTGTGTNHTPATGDMNIFMLVLAMLCSLSVLVIAVNKKAE